MKLSKAARLLVGGNLLTGAAVVLLLAAGAATRSTPPSAAISSRTPPAPGPGPGVPAEAGGARTVPPAVPRPPALPPPEPLPASGGPAPRAPSDAATRTRRLVAEVALACELAKGSRGEFPASGTGDGVNEGAEALHAALVAGGWLGRVVRDAPVGDTDGDGREEVLDLFGNPLLYFRNDRYDAPARYRISGHDVVAVPQLSARTGEYHARDFVMVWSAGPDGENANGLDDDITSWHIRD